MKVICIDASKGKQSGLKLPFKEGDILTAIQSAHYPASYKIIEYPYAIDGYPACYTKDRFIPLSTIDETELQQHRECSQTTN